jgi:hypothetical protein
MINIGLEQERDYIVKTFQYISGNWDNYMAFFEKGISLAKCVLCYITPDKWLSKPFGLKFRELCMMPNMKQILHVGSNIFENVKVDGIVSLLVSKSDKLTTLKFDKKQNVTQITTVEKRIIKHPFLIDFLFSNNFSLINKIEQTGTKTIFDFVQCENACATNDAYKLTTFVENNATYDIEKYLILINTGTFGKYNHKWGKKEITYLGNKILYPIVNKDNFLSNFGKSYIRKSVSPKIIFKGLNLLDACIDFKGNILPGKSTLVICSDNFNLLKILCSLINSKLAFFYIKTKYSSSSYCGGITFTKDMINNFPVPDILFALQHPLISLVNQILSAKKENPTTDTSALETEIDRLVYRLYGLTEEEIKIIDGRGELR